MALRGLNRIVNTVHRKQHVALFHTGRCGSTALGKLLGSHSRIFWAGEIFEKFMRKENERAPGDRGARFVDEIVRRSRDARISSIYGFETKFLPQQHLSAHCIDLALDEYVRRLDTLGFERFIVLHRKNYLRRAVSAQVSRETGTWHSTRGAEKATKVMLDLNAFRTGTTTGPILDLFASMDRSLNRINELLADRRVVSLTYEDDILPDPRIGYRKVCELLGIRDENPAVELRRTNPFRFEETVENLGCVRALLANTKYEWMLTE